MMHGSVSPNFDTIPDEDIYSALALNMDETFSIGNNPDKASHLLETSQPILAEDLANRPVQVDRRGTENNSVEDDDNFKPEECILLFLRDSSCQIWREISAYFECVLGEKVRTSTLQMRYIRLQKRLGQCKDKAMLALLQAHAEWEKEKWQYISTKVDSVFYFCLFIYIYS